MAFCEAIWLGKANKRCALASFRKQMREDDPRRLEVLYKNYVVDALPLKPYPMEEVIQTEIENLTPTVPELRGKRAADLSIRPSSSNSNATDFLPLSATNTGNMPMSRARHGL